MTCCPWQPFSTWLQLWAFSNKPAALRWLEDTPAALPLTPRYDPHHDCPHPIHWAEFHTSVPRAQVEKELLPQPQRPHKPELISQDNICSGIALDHAQDLTELHKVCKVPLPRPVRDPFPAACRPHHTAQRHHQPWFHWTFCPQRCWAAPVPTPAPEKPLATIMQCQEKDKKHTGSSSICSPLLHVRNNYVSKKLLVVLTVLKVWNDVEFPTNVLH